MRPDQIAPLSPASSTAPKSSTPSSPSTACLSIDERVGRSLHDFDRASPARSKRSVVGSGSRAAVFASSIEGLREALLAEVEDPADQQHRDAKIVGRTRQRERLMAPMPGDYSAEAAGPVSTVPPMSWPPTVGEPLPRAEDAWREQIKLEGWILAERGHGAEWQRVFHVSVRADSADNCLRGEELAGVDDA